jgi:two-component system, cell cycle response regulator DivK
MDGWEATEKIKSNPQTRRIPIYAVTAHALPDDRKRAFDAGCDGYVTKPLDLVELVEVVHNALQH